jgi:hypothetical protein
VPNTGTTGRNKVSLSRSDLSPLKLNSPDYPPDLGVRVDHAPTCASHHAGDGY